MYSIPIKTKNLNITSPFGWRTLNGTRNFHNGIDLGYAQGTPIYAMQDGVLESRRDQYGANWQRLHVGNGYWDYVHMHQMAFPLWSKVEVKQGQFISTVGNTGFSFGNHLHLGFYENGRGWVNPIPLVNMQNFLYNIFINNIEDMAEFIQHLKSIDESLKIISSIAYTSNIATCELKTGERLQIRVGGASGALVFRVGQSNWRALGGNSNGYIQLERVGETAVLNIRGMDNGLYENSTQDGKSWKGWQKLF